MKNNNLFSKFTSNSTEYVLFKWGIVLNTSELFRINCCPIGKMIRYKLKCQLFFELGPMFGVLVKATDVFYNTISEKNDVSYKNNIYGKCNWFDVGAMGGFGYHFMKGTGLNLGVRYYYGFTNILAKGVSDPGQNNSLYIYLSIPIGAWEKSQAKATKKAKEKAEKAKEKNAKKQWNTHPGIVNFNTG